MDFSLTELQFESQLQRYLKFNVIETNEEKLQAASNIAIVFK